MILLEKINVYDGPSTIALPMKGKSLDYVYNVGRLEGKDRDGELDIAYPIRSEGVSRRHCQVFFDRKYGWMIKEDEEAPSTSGTWMHPKFYY